MGMDAAMNIKIYGPDRNFLCEVNVVRAISSNPRIAYLPDAEGNVFLADLPWHIFQTIVDGEKIAIVCQCGLEWQSLPLTGRDSLWMNPKLKAGWAYDRIVDGG
jgi:hypothetical protein